MTDFLQLCFAGLALGANYSLVALGFVVIHRATGVINFAQGSMLALGAYFTFNIHVTWGVNFYLAAVIAIGASAVVGVLIERLLLSRMTGEPVFSIIMITIGLLFVLDQVITMVWGQNAQNLEDPWGIRTVTAMTIGAELSSPFTSSIMRMVSDRLGETVTWRTCWSPRAKANSLPGTSTRRM